MKVLDVFYDPRLLVKITLEKYLTLWRAKAMGISEIRGYFYPLSIAYVFTL